MMYCKYCGKQIAEDEVCSCQQEAKVKKAPILLISVVGVLIIALIACILLLSQGNEPSDNPSVGDSQNNGDNSTNDNDNNGNNNSDNESQDDSNTTGGSGDDESALTKINPFDFVDQASYYGYDGQGEISIFPDRAALITAIVGDRPNTNDEEVLAEWFQKYESYDAAIDGIKISYSKNGNLKNGDIVTVTITMPDLLTDRVENASKAYTVSGLLVVDFVELFDDIKITYEGNSGEAYAYVERLSDSDYINSCNFEITPNDYLSNGDEITVSITNAGWLLELFNVVPQTLSKTFRVDELPEYLTSANQLPDSIIEYYSELSLAETDTSDFFEYSYSAPEIYGVYLMTLKFGKYGYKNVLSVIVSYGEYVNREYNATVYETYEYVNLTINSDGTVKHLNTKWGKLDTNYGQTIDSYLIEYKDDYTVFDILNS